MCSTKSMYTLWVQISNKLHKHTDKISHITDNNGLYVLDWIWQAQAAGQIEKYALDVVIGKGEEGIVRHSALYAALVSLLHTLQVRLEQIF